jgi:hypothetical protein
MFVVGVSNVIVSFGLQYCLNTSEALHWSLEALLPHLLSTTEEMLLATELETSLWEQMQD